MIEPYRYAVLMATRGRPWNLTRLHAAVADTAARPDLVDFWVYVDEDDPVGMAAYQQTEVPAFRWIEGPRLRLAGTWNQLAEQASATGRYTHLLTWGDDVLPETPAWDALFATATEVRGPGFYYGRDGIWDGRPLESNPEHLVLPTATAITTDLYEAVGYIAPPGLKHLCIDCAWRDLGLATGTLHFLPEIMIRHIHRIAGAPDDETYREANDGQQKTDDFNAYNRWVHSDHFNRTVDRINAFLEARGGRGDG